MNVEPPLPGGREGDRAERAGERAADRSADRGGERAAGRAEADGYRRDLDRPRRVRPYDSGPDAKIYRSRAHRRRRLNRHRRRAYIRSVYFLPSLATLGNAVCGFGAMYVAAFDLTNVGEDPWARWLLAHKFLAAAYLIIIAMVFDALDGRLARFARHTTDFGGQLDSLADVVSFGAAPAFITLMLFKEEGPIVPYAASRLIWAIAALYFSCAAIRLARFNVSNEHGEQHHFSFLGLPSPGAAAAVVGAVLIQQDLRELGLEGWRWARSASFVMTCLLPAIVLSTGLLMVSAIRYPHMVNRYLRGRRSIARLLGGVAVLLLVVVAHRYAFGLGSIAYAMYGPFNLALSRVRPRTAGFPGEPRPAAPPAAEPLPPSPAPR
jgi:CDP-diacylglycerol--serine O-phosphatidyltransferase